MAAQAVAVFAKVIHRLLVWYPKKVKRGDASSSLGRVVGSRSTL